MSGYIIRFKRFMKRAFGLARLLRERLLGRAPKRIPAIEHASQLEITHETSATAGIPKKPIRKLALSLDSGGSRMLPAVMVLKRIEKIIKEIKPGATLQSVFDMMAGSGAGGLGALILAGIDGSGWSDMQKLFVLKGQSIFTESRKPFYKSASSKYSLAGLSRTLAESFKEKKMSDTLNPVMVTAFDTLSLKPVILSRENGFGWMSLAQAALATLAMPSLFDPLELSHDGKKLNLIGGGACAPNPCLLAYEMARRIFKDADEIHIISIGPYQNPEGLGASGHAFTWTESAKGEERAMQTVFRAAQERMACDMMRAMDGARFLRIENSPERFTDRFRLDSHQEHDTVRLLEIGEAIADEHDAELRRFLATALADD